MADAQIKITEKNYKTDEKSLMQEIKEMLSDYFVCSLSDGENSTIISLENGQKFSLYIREIAKIENCPTKN